MLELLNQLDGFASDDRVKVLAATNRVDVLDPALLRSGRLDRKIEFPLPNEEARAQILRIHSRKMTVDDAVNWGELARSTDEFGGAQLKAVCVEAGMIALRLGKNKINHENYVDAIAEVQVSVSVRGRPQLCTDRLQPSGQEERHRQLLRITASQRVDASHSHRHRAREYALTGAAWLCFDRLRVRNQDRDSKSTSIKPSPLATEQAITRGPLNQFGNRPLHVSRSSRFCQAWTAVIPARFLTDSL